MRQSQQPDGRATAAAPAAAPVAERGVALIMALIFTILLYILVAELVVSSRMIRATGENDALLARMRSLMSYQLADAEQQLVDDLAGQLAGGEGGGSGGLGALGGLGGAEGAGGAGGEGEAEEDPSTKCDSSRDAWYHPTGYPEDDITTYVWVEDENRKLNILALWSEDEEFAEFSRDRLVRLLDSLREDTEFDLATGDAERIAQEIKDWAKRPDLEAIPRPKLKSDDERRREISLPMHLDELMMLPSVTEDLFFDKVLDGKVYLGLESVLTLWTSLVTDPGDPDKTARQRAREAEREALAGTGESTGAGAAGAGSQGAEGASAGKKGGGLAPRTESQAPPQPEGLGIRININTATRPVLRALFPPDKIPDRVLDEIVRYRNEVDEDEMQKLEEGGQSTEVSDFGDLRLGPDRKLKFFETVEDLDKVEAFRDLPDPQLKADFQNALTTKSDVFTIHVATLHKRSEENRVYVLRRARSVVMRVDENGEGVVVPLVPFEERKGLRVQPVDLQEERASELSIQYAEMDRFAQEERAWNPFLVDFYLPNHVRDGFYRPQ